MSRVLITSWGSYGDVYPYVGLAVALRNRGHHPVLAMPEFYRPLLEGLGFEFHGVGAVIDPNDHATIARVMDPVKGTEVIVDGLLMPSLRGDYAALDAIAARGVDAIITHPITFAGPVVAQVRRLRWISSVLAPISFFSAHDLPAIPAAPRLVYVRHLGLWAARAIGRIARSASAKWVEPVQSLRREVGLPRSAHPLFEGQFSPTMTLALFSEVLGAPQPDWPSNVVTTGFVFYNGPDPLSPRLEEFLAAGDSPVLFTLGSSAVGAAGTFYDESVKAVTRLGVRGVLLTGGFAQNVPRNLPRTVLAVDRAPHQLLMPRSSAIVHQVGVGTTGQALRSGKPMLVVPHGHDQPDNAFRVTKLGVARTVSPKSYQERRVARELGMLLADGRYRARAAQIAGVVQAEGGAEAAASAVERVLGTSV